FAPWVRANRERLSADYCLVCDIGIEAPDKPVIVYALRGMLALELTVQGPKADLHSGHHGGRVHNPAQVIAEMVAKLHHDDGSIAVPGFYEDVRELSPDERAELEKGGMSRADFDAAIGAPEYRRMGASIPIAPVMQSELGIPTLIVGFNVADAGFHGPNEFIHIDLFHRGTRTMIHLLQDLGGHT
ncbi:MAG: hypothetical protein ACLFO1_08825, partial [Spirochaetaceae bacterium]